MKSWKIDYKIENGIQFYLLSKKSWWNKIFIIIRRKSKTDIYFNILPFAIR